MAPRNKFTREEMIAAAVRVVREKGIDALTAKGDFAPINEWNKENIWQYGSFYKPNEILEKVLGEPFDPSVYLDYLEDKVKSVYGV